MALKTFWIVTRTRFTNRGNVKTYLQTEDARSWYGTWAGRRSTALRFEAPEVAQEEADKHGHQPSAFYTYDAAKVQETRFRV